MITNRGYIKNVNVMAPEKCVRWCSEQIMFFIKIFYSTSEHMTNYLDYDAQIIWWPLERITGQICRECKIIQYVVSKYNESPVRTWGFSKKP